MTETLQCLLSIHSKAGVIISGDRNSLEISALLSVDPALRQIVHQPTHGYKILDVIATNLVSYYNDPEIIPPINPDRPGYGVPSDHMGVSATPCKIGAPVKKVKVQKIIRPLPESLIPCFEKRFAELNFKDLSDQPVSQIVEDLESKVNLIVNESFPEKKITISPYDEPWFNEQLRSLKRQRQRRYQTHGKDTKYLKLKEIFDEKMNVEIEKYKQKIETDVVEGRRGSTYPALRRFGARQYYVTNDSFQLPEYAQLQLSPVQSAERLADYFSMISQEFSPLDTANLPPNLQHYLSNYDQSVAPKLTTQQVLLRIMKAKKPNSIIPGDLPPKLVKRCAAMIAEPITTIYNTITTRSSFPSQWKIEYQIAIPKVSQPESEDELRNIAKTQFLSKVYESFVGGWLLPIIKPYLDPGQCGLAGFSITHYLIKLMHFIQETLDNKRPHAVLAASVDISKAFNRIAHNLVIQDLYDMHTPAWLLNIVISYLSDRSMFLTFNNIQSSQKPLPGGGPQGAYLGGLIFIIKYNGAFLRPPVPRLILGPVQASKSEKVKFVDDGTVAVSINLKDCLVPDLEEKQRPLNYNERTHHVLPSVNNLLQYYIQDTEVFVADNKMIINKRKTKVMKFNKARKWDFPPDLKFTDNTGIEHVPDMKLVGVILSENLSWYKNTQYICGKARQKLWILRRLLKFNLDTTTLFDVYTKEIRSILELAVPVWHSGLTKQQTANIERIQKIAFKIILGDHYSNYTQACQILSAQTLEERRVKLCLNFARKNLRSSNSFFTRIRPNMITRGRTSVVKEFKCRTKRFQNSSLPYLAKLLNQNNKNTTKK